MSINISHVVITGIVNSSTIVHLFDRIEWGIKISGSIEIEGHTVEKSRGQYKLSSPKTHYRYPGDVYSKDLMFILGHVAQRISAGEDNHLFINPDDLVDNPPEHPKLQDLDIWTDNQLRDWIKSRVFPNNKFIEGS